MVKRKEAAWIEVLGAKDEAVKEKCLEAYKKRKVKMCIYQNKEEVNEKFERKMNQNVKGNRKLFCKKVSKGNGGKESCSRIKDGYGKLAQGEAEIERVWRSILRIFII